VNPSLFGRGEWKNIKAIRATFDFNNREVKTEWAVETGEKSEDLDRFARFKRKEPEQRKNEVEFLVEQMDAKNNVEPI